MPSDKESNTQQKDLPSYRTILNVPEAPAPDQLEVCGAGTEEVNGIYVKKTDRKDNKNFRYQKERHLQWRALQVCYMEDEQQVGHGGIGIRKDEGR